MSERGRSGTNYIMPKNPSEEMMVRYRAVAISIIPLLVVSTVLGIFVVPHPVNAAASSSDTGPNWEYINYNLNGTNASPQTAIGPSNVGSLVMNWTVPMPATDPNWGSVNAKYCYPNCATWQVEPGADSPPLVVNGIVYFVTNQGVLYALNAANGVQVWTKTITSDFQAALKTVPIIESQVGAGNISPCSSTACGYNDTFWCSTTTNPSINCASPVQHKHGINYLTINNKGIISVTGFDCELWGFNAITGDVAYHITNICTNATGNGGGAYPATYASDPPEYYDGMLVYVMGGYTDMGGRTFLAAFNASAVVAAGAKGFNGAMNGAPAGQGQMWQIFLQPPSSGDSQWDYENCNVGWVFDYPAFAANGTKAIPCSQIPNSVKSIGATSTSPGGDWGIPKAAAAGISGSWGQYAIDNKTGIMYFGTGEAGPFEYCYGPTCPNTPNERPGLNLYSSSELAVNLHTGKIVWWFQMVPHGLSDWDASWATIIGTTNGTESIFKASKAGILFSMNAATGAPNWVFDNPSVKWAPGLRPLDPTSVTAMETPWPYYPNATWIQAPSLAGSLEQDLAYDGQNIYGAWFNSSPTVEVINNSTQYASTVRTLGAPAWQDNVTVTAVNANTGKAVWNRFFNSFVFRGGMTVTNGMLVMPTGNGTIYFLSTKTGATISKLYIGSPLFVDPTIGTAANGKTMLFQIIGGGRWLGVGQVGGSLTQPGALMAFSLGTGVGIATTATSTTVVAVQSNLPLNYIAYAAVTFAIIVTVANVAIRGRNKR
jgi:outer membrane protein assembly factor BamB